MQPEAVMQAKLNNIQRQKQQFIADVLDPQPTVMYRADDYATMRRLIFDKVKRAVEKRFPIYNDKYVLSVQNVQYIDPQDVSYMDQKKAIMQGANVGRRLRGSFVLTDAATNKVVSKTEPKTLIKVPYMSDRGTFINSGHEYTFNNIMRLQPGVYTKKHNDDQISAQFNVKKGTGAGFSMRFTPSKGLFQMSRGTANAPAYTVLKDMGVTDQQMEASWGKDLFNLNKEYGTGQKARIAANRIYNYSNI